MKLDASNRGELCGEDGWNVAAIWAALELAPSPRHNVENIMIWQLPSQQRFDVMIQLEEHQTFSAFHFIFQLWCGSSLVNVNFRYIWGYFGGRKYSPVTGPTNTTARYIMILHSSMLKAACDLTGSEIQNRVGVKGRCCLLLFVLYARLTIDLQVN